MNPKGAFPGKKVLQSSQLTPGRGADLSHSTAVVPDLDTLVARLASCFFYGFQDVPHAHLFGSLKNALIEVEHLEILHHHGTIRTAAASLN